MDMVIAGAAALVGVALIVWGAETFAEHLARAAAGLGVTMFALAVLLAGAEPEELATGITASIRDAAPIALGDVVGANVVAALLALGVGAAIAPLPFTARVRRYGLGSLAAGVLAAAIAWDGRVSRLEGMVLLAAYATFVAAIWLIERRPPELGEAGEVEEAIHATGRGEARYIGLDLALTLAGSAAMVVGSILVVDGVRHLTGAEDAQTRLAVSVVGLATGFELVVLAWSSVRRGISDSVVAGVIGSYAYNSTMTLGASAVVRPLAISESRLLQPGWLIMVAALGIVLLLTSFGGNLSRREGVLCILLYPIAIGAILLI